MDQLTTPPAASRRATAAGDWLFGSALLVTAVLIFTPFAPLMPATGLDPSWMLGMNQAMGQDLVIGRDIVFTFGPYASIYTKSYHPATDQLMVWGGLYLGLCFFAAAFLNFRRSPVTLQVAFVFALVTLVYSPDALLFLYPLMAGVLVCSSVERRQALSSTGPIALLAAPIGLLPLIKLSAGAAGLGVMGVACLYLLARRQWRQAFTVLAVPPLAMVLFWALSGQPLDALADYLRSATQIIAGYPEAMKLQGSPGEPLAYAICALALVATVWQARPGEGLVARAAVALLFLGILFLAFKAGFVRHDFHATIAASAILLAALLAVTLSTWRALFPGLLAFGLIMSAHPPWSVGTGFDGLSALRSWSSGWRGIAVRLGEPERLRADFDAELAKVMSTAGLPDVEGTSDIYSFNQVSLLASGNRWNPRPVFQSYSAYTPELAEMNRRHIEGPGRPENLFFRLEPIDFRLPALEDGPSWRVILSDYRLADKQKGYLILRPRDDGGPTPSEANPPLMLSGRLGETLTLPETEGLVFAKLHIAESLAGRLWSVLYKPTELHITLTTKSGGKSVFKLIAGLARSEFLLSPLVASDDAFATLLKGQALPNDDVTTLMIDTDGWPRTWMAEYQLELTPLPLPRR